MEKPSEEKIAKENKKKKRAKEKKKIKEKKQRENVDEEKKRVDNYCMLMRRKSNSGQLVG